MNICWSVVLVKSLLVSSEFYRSNSGYIVANRVPFVFLLMALGSLSIIIYSTDERLKTKHLYIRLDAINSTRNILQE